MCGSITVHCAFETGKLELALFDPPSSVEWAAAGALDLDLSPATDA